MQGNPLITLSAIPIALSLLWWVVTHLSLKHHRQATPVRLTLAVTASFFIAAYAWTAAYRVLLYSRSGYLPFEPPGFIQYAGLLWAAVALPLAVLPLLLLQGLAALCRWQRKPKSSAPPNPDPDSDPNTTPAPLSRRGFLSLSTASLSIPPLATAAASVVAYQQNQAFRTTRLTVPIPDLPKPLHGLTIAHLSDSHFGEITHGHIINQIVEQTNALEPDLICFTGDLINHSKDDLDVGIDCLRRLRPKHALALVEGNHDLLHGRDAFETPVRKADLNLLLNQSHHLTIERQRVDLLGLVWQSYNIWTDLGDLQGTIRPNAFPILLAHHPKLFDHAHKYNIPLTLAGHTHGGQIMLHREFGPGPLFFKYWSGLYHQYDTTLHVSNGVGNWFPLRFNAPAEISLLTLQPAPPAPPT
ncbi:MAG: metallophosphoesterase [Planctomycetota bacterium]